MFKFLKTFAKLPISKNAKTTCTLLKSINFFSPVTFSAYAIVYKPNYNYNSKLEESISYKENMVEVMIEEAEMMSQKGDIKSSIDAYERALKYSDDYLGESHILSLRLHNHLT